MIPLTPENDGLETVAEMLTGNAVETEVIAPVLEDTRNGELRALTRHIDRNPQIQAQLERQRLANMAAEAEADGIEKIQSEILPANYAETHALLKEAQKMVATTPAQAKLRDARVDRIAAHLHALGQGPVSPKLNVTHLSNWRPVVGAGGRKAALLALCDRYPIVREVYDELQAAN